MKAKNDTCHTFILALHREAVVARSLSEIVAETRSVIQEAVRRSGTRSAFSGTKNGYPGGYPLSLPACELLT